MWTSDLGLGNNPTLAAMVVQWTGANGRSFVDQWPNDMTWDGGLGTLRPYRCMWTNELR